MREGDEDSSESEEENLAHVDGGKLSQSTRKEIKALINTKYVFKNFNVLMYAENYIFPQASAAEVSEMNREELYTLYYMAHRLEPEPKTKELTFT